MKDKKRGFKKNIGCIFYSILQGSFTAGKSISSKHMFTSAPDAYSFEKLLSKNLLYLTRAHRLLRNQLLHKSGYSPCLKFPFYHVNPVFMFSIAE